MAKAAGYLPHTGPIVTRAAAKAAGAKRYFTGKPCPKGHIAERYLSKGNCVGCLRTQERDREKAKAYSRAYHVAKAAQRPPRVLTPKIVGPLTFDQVNDYVVYDQATGLFTWRKTRGHFRAGEPAGYVNPYGYVVINLFFVPRRAHRLAWLLTHGEWPTSKIDHRNGERADNRLANLRLADDYQNAWNGRPHSDGKSGFKGVVYLSKRNKPWQARIKFKGRGKTLGYFATAEEAHACYVQAATTGYLGSSLPMPVRQQAGDAEIVRQAKERFARCVAWESAWRERALFDTRFANGDPLNCYQWDTNVRSERGSRPCLTYNQTRQHNLQVQNDNRQHKAQIKVSPSGGRASYKAAQVFSGIIRRIEYQSKAVDAYATATYHQVESGIGYVRVDTGYCNDNSFDLDLFIKRVKDPRSIYMDPDCEVYDKSDAMFGFVFEDIERKRYEDEHGKDDQAAPAALDHTDGWNDRDHVRIAEYWRVAIDTTTIHRLHDGTVVRDDEIPAELRDQVKALIDKSREVQERSVQWFKIAGDKIVDREDWPGKYMPIVPWIGEETVIAGEMDRKGHTRSQIDAQRIYNYWASAAVEQVALQTKSPYVARADAIEGREEQWATANTKNWSVLLYNPLDEQGNAIQRPEREPPPQMAQAYIQGMQIAKADLMSVTGQYQAELGAPSNERSGVAIQQRQRQGDNATYHYTDNQAKGIRQVGRILIDLIPKIYDTPRVVLMLAEDGSESKVLVAPDAPDAHQQVQPQPDGSVAPVMPGQAQAAQDDPNAPDPAVIFNPNVGEYSVEADVGPAFGTQRQEAANAFSEIMQQNPAAFQIVGDYWAANSDFPGADELAERLKRGLPPQYKAGPDPQVVQVQQAAQQQAQHAHELLGQADQEIAALKQQLATLQMQGKDKDDELKIKDYDAETRRLAAVGAIDPHSLQVIVRGLVEDMLGTRLQPVLEGHADVQGDLASRMAPPVPTNGADASGAAPGPSSGQMVQ